jgi:hypothetical protein
VVLVQPDHSNVNRPAVLHKVVNNALEYSIIKLIVASASRLLVKTLLVAYCKNLHLLRPFIAA